MFEQKPKQSEEFNKFFPLVKVDEKNHMTWGIVTSETVDKDGEICSYEDAKKSYKEWSDDFVEKTTAAGQEPSMGNVRIMHKPEIGGKVIKLEFKDDEKQIWVGTQPVNDEVWDLIKGGYITGLSQGGRYLWKKQEGEYTRYAPKISEVSYVDNPALGEACFVYVKSDGSTEIRKFSSPALPAVQGNLKLESTPITSVRPPCACDCDQCVKGFCQNCLKGSVHPVMPKVASISSLLKNMVNAERRQPGVRYLVEYNDNQGYLPYSRGLGKADHQIMVAAWAALYSPKGYRGQVYTGPNKDIAKRKLKQAFAREGMDNPIEKMEQISPMIDEMLKDAIQSRVYGQLGKGLYTISNFARILEDLKYLWLSMEYERESEGDESPVTDDIHECFESLLDHLVEYASEQIEEEKARVVS